VNLEQFWADFTAVIQERRALIVSWLKIGTVLSFARSVMKVGFPTTEAHARDSLNRDNQKKYLESVAEEILGTTVKFEFVLDASLAPPMASEMSFDLLDSPPPKPEPKAEPVRADEPAAAPSASAVAATEAAPAAAAEDFQNDPLIKAAVEKFRLKLVARQ
jgi:DNA polymerase-3 subunit gamma/tau